MILEVDNTAWTAIEMAMEAEVRHYLEGSEQASSEQIKEDLARAALIYRQLLDELTEQINRQTKD